MKLLFNLLFACVSLILLGYLVLPTLQFPQKPTDSVQSTEEWDTETSLRRGYMTNLTRPQVTDLYYEQISHIGTISLPTIRLNYPPEDAQTLIRDQTRSSYLEEFVHPFRESLFVNGYIPDKDIYEIYYRGVKFDQKVVIKYAPTDLRLRVALFLTSAILLYFVLLELAKTMKSLFKEWLLTKYE